ncbi:MAG: hypothetical protein AAFZ15_07680 [Bacteroidota bacterium]
MNETNTSTDLPSGNTFGKELRAKIYSDIFKMVDHATKKGKLLPMNLDLSQMDTDKELIASYNTITSAIAPATLNSINYINSQILMGQKSRKWYEIPIFTKCLFIAFFSLVALILISMLPNVNEANQAKGMLSSEGMILLQNLLFICFASLLGVMFYLLKTISDKIKDFSLLPIDAIEVNASILIGVISGFVISELFSFDSVTIGTSVKMERMTLALLGGFSSDAIFSLLQGVVKKVKQLITPLNG